MHMKSVRKQRDRFRGFEVRTFKLVHGKRVAAAEDFAVSEVDVRVAELKDAVIHFSGLVRRSKVELDARSVNNAFNQTGVVEVGLNFHCVVVGKVDADVVGEDERLRARGPRVEHLREVGGGVYTRECEMVDVLFVCADNNATQSNHRPSSHRLGAVAVAAIELEDLVVVHGALAGIYFEVGVEKVDNVVARLIRDVCARSGSLEPSNHAGFIATPAQLDFVAPPCGTVVAKCRSFAHCKDQERRERVVVDKSTILA